MSREVLVGKRRCISTNSVVGNLAERSHSTVREPS